MMPALISPSAPIDSQAFRDQCKAILDRDGALVLPGFLEADAVEKVRAEGEKKIAEAYFCATSHNVYLTAQNEALAPDHPFNRQVISSKGLIGDDQVDENSPLKQLYHSDSFKGFIRHVVGEAEIHPYADPLSSVNLHFAKSGQELGWHFDNSSFAITLLIQKPDGGGHFEYVRDLRDADSGEMNFEGVGAVLDGAITPSVLDMEPGTLVLFRGRNSMHRVTPSEGTSTRMIAVMAYNTKPDIALSRSAMETFYGRVA